MRTKIILCGAVLVLAVGCQRDRDPVGVGDTFPRDPKASGNVDRFAAVQAARGARHDGMLYAYHFDGDKLNSLGREKLELMVIAPGYDYPVVVFLNIPDDAHSGARRQAVADHLTHEYALHTNQFQLVSGPNPDCSSPVGRNLQAYTVSEQQPAAAAPAAGAPAAGGGASSSASPMP